MERGEESEKIFLANFYNILRDNEKIKLFYKITFIDNIDIFLETKSP